MWVMQVLQTMQMIRIGESFGPWIFILLLVVLVSCRLCVVVHKKHNKALLTRIKTRFFLLDGVFKTALKETFSLFVTQLPPI